MAGLTSALTAEKGRSTRLQLRRQGVEKDLEKAKADIVSMVASEQARFDERVGTVLKERDELLERVARAEKKQKFAEQALVATQESAAKVSYQLELSENARRKADESLVSLGVMVESLRESLAAVPSREMIVEHYKSSNDYKREFINSRLAAVESYKRSDEFADEISRAMNRGIEEYKNSEACCKDREAAGRDAVNAFRASDSFKQAVGAEAGRLSLQIVEGCREFFKGDIQRPSQDFGLFFTEFVRRRRSSFVDKSTSGGPGPSLS